MSLHINSNSNKKRVSFNPYIFTIPFHTFPTHPEKHNYIRTHMRARTHSPNSGSIHKNPLNYRVVAVSGPECPHTNPKYFPAALLN
jgi:hypothetical protein